MTQEQNLIPKKRLVFIAGELSPFIELDYFSVVLNELMVTALEDNYEVRCILPKWSFVNERRYRLHEVIRLSNLNVRIEHTDYGLEIKVASFPRVRIQVYFLGNEDLFKVDQSIYYDHDGKWDAKNELRNIFFCKSVLQILKKFGWPPDLIFCSHWITSLLPFYIKKVHKNEAIFQKAKIISTIGVPEFDEKLDKKFLQLINLDDNVEKEDLIPLRGLKFLNFQKMAIHYSDAVLLLDDKKKINKSVLNYLKDTDDKEIIKFKYDSDRMEYIKLFEILL